LGYTTLKLAQTSVVSTRLIFVYVMSPDIKVMCVYEQDMLNITADLSDVNC